MRIHISLARISMCCFFLLEGITARAQSEKILDAFDIHHTLAYLIAIFLIMLFVMVFANRLYYYREQEAGAEARRINAQLSMILASNKTQTWVYDISQHVFKVYTDDNKEISYFPFDFTQNYDPSDVGAIRNTIKSMTAGETLSESFLIKGPIPKDAETEQRIYDVNVSVLRHDKHHRPTALLGIQHDITEEKKNGEKVRKLMLRYHNVFNSSLVDMIFYDADGYLTEINDKACETFCISDRDSLLRRRIKITDIPAYKDLDIEHLDHLLCSSITNIDKVKREDEKVPEVLLRGTIYYEVSVRALRNEDGSLRGIVTAGRNITEMVESHHHERQVSRQLNTTTKDIQTYIDNINYSLKASNVQLMSYNPETHILELFSDLSKAQYRLTELRAIALLQEDCHRRARGYFRRMDQRQKQTFTCTFPTIMRDSRGRDIYLSFHIMPIFTPDGHVTHYFGMCRNETEITYTELQLQEETAKAQDAEQLKNTFLLNMSYELRTPLNAVLGFAELYNNEHSVEDEPVFAEEIRKNTNVLLRLIDDILFISRLDAHMIEFNYQECDFVPLFEGWCYMGWSALPPEVKTSVDNPYNHLNVIIDQQNLGMVVQKICANAVYTTHEGRVRAKCEYRHGELMITIEDTGTGFTAEAKERLFNRFERETEHDHPGTGLDLPIVKELLQQMGGTIELQTEPDKGSTFYISVPCEMTSLEKKAEIII